jgi:hypothetical protein
MSESKLGIGYTDGTEKIVQLNRPIENNLWKQAQDLTDMLFSQLGLTPEVFNGTASPQVMTAYYDRTIKPILAAITEEMVRKFLTKTARTQGQTIKFFRNPFGLIPIGDLAQVVDALSRNSVVTPNEFRSELGFKPSEQPIADDLSNKNMPANPNQIQNGLTNEETQAAYESAMADLNVVDEALSMDHSDEPSAPARSRDRRVKSNSRAPTFIPGNRNKKKQYIDQLLKT